MFGFIKRGGNKSAWIIAFINVVIFTLMSLVIPQFIEIFRQSNAELPGLTLIMIEFHSYTSIIGGLGLLGALLVQFNHHKLGWFFIGISSSILFVAIVLTIIGMYAPIFSMGQVVNESKY